MYPHRHISKWFAWKATGQPPRLSAREYSRKKRLTLRLTTGGLPALWRPAQTPVHPYPSPGAVGGAASCKAGQPVGGVRADIRRIVRSIGCATFGHELRSRRKNGRSPASEPGSGHPPANRNSVWSNGFHPRLAERRGMRRYPAWSVRRRRYDCR